MFFAEVIFDNRDEFDANMLRDEQLYNLFLTEMGEAGYVYDPDEDDISNGSARLFKESGGTLIRVACNNTVTGNVYVTVTFWVEEYGDEFLNRVIEAVLTNEDDIIVLLDAIS